MPSSTATKTKEGLKDPVVDDEEERQRRSKIQRIVRRDATFLIVGALAASVLGWMELHAADADKRGEHAASTVDAQRGIIDTGYIATKPLHDFLRSHRAWNDALAFLNTIIGVLGPGAYIAYETLWVGDYEPAFRYLAISVLRSFCGWFTYLPPDPSYLMSNYDFPDVMQCMTKECGDPETAELNPFVSFFSGHVATLVICANHMYLRDRKSLGLFFHAFNVFQIIRLLATRGHYSIDIIIGWYMAVHVCNPAGRLGRYFSRGDDVDDFLEANVPQTATEAFETVTGVYREREHERMSVVMKMHEVQEALKTASSSANSPDSQADIAQPTARLVAEGKLDSLVEDKLDEILHMIRQKNKDTKEKES